MALILAVTWTAKLGNEEAVSEILRRLGEASRQEVGMLTYTTHVDPGNHASFSFTRSITMQADSRRTRKPRISRNWYWKKGYPCLNPGYVNNTLIYECFITVPVKRADPPNPPCEFAS